MRLNLCRNRKETGDFIINATMGSSLYLFFIGHPEFAPTLSNFFESLFFMFSLSVVSAVLVIPLHFIVVKFEEITHNFIFMIIAPHYILLFLINLAGGGYFNHYIPDFSFGFYIAGLINIMVLLSIALYLCIKNMKSVKN